MVMTTEDFLAAVERYLGKSGTSPTRFGKDVLGDPNFVFQLREGRKVSLENVNKVLAHIDRETAASAPERCA